MEYLTGGLSRRLCGACQLFHCFGCTVFIRELGCVCRTRWKLRLHWFWSVWPSREIYDNTHLDEGELVEIFIRRLMASVKKSSRDI